MFDVYILNNFFYNLENEEERGGVRVIKIILLVLYNPITLRLSYLNIF